MYVLHHLYKTLAHSLCKVSYNFSPRFIFTNNKFGDNNLQIGPLNIGNNYTFKFNEFEIRSVEFRARFEACSKEMVSKIRCKREGE